MIVVEVVGQLQDSYVQIWNLVKLVGIEKLINGRGIVHLLYAYRSEAPL